MNRNKNNSPDACIELRGYLFKVWVCKKGITRIVLPDVSNIAETGIGETSVGMFLSIFSEVNPSEGRNLELLLEYFEKMFNGKEPLFVPEYSLDNLSSFTRKVLDVTSNIPWGETRSYSWVAGKLGNGRAARAVGSSLGNNPLPVVIPCHRVIRSNGEPGGYSGGLSWKKHLLSIEAEGLTRAGRSDAG